MIRTSTGWRLYHQIIDCALTHGADSDSDYQVGDLQEALYQAMEFLSQEQIAMLAAKLKQIEQVGFE